MPTTENVARVLTVAEAVKLGALVDAVISGKRCRFLIPDTSTVVTGTLRSIGDENGYFAGPNDDGAFAVEEQS
jgi:hypothetical protein